MKCRGAVVLGGGLNPREAMPVLSSMYREGRLKLDELVTRRYRLKQINEAVAICGKAGISGASSTFSDIDFQ